MSDVLSRVQILLDANTAKFEQNIKSAQKTSETSFTKISSSAKAMAGIVATATVAGAASLYNYSKEQAKVIGELERNAFLAQSTVQEFQKMSVGAEMFGVQQDKLADITKDFNEKLGDFLTTGGGEYVNFLEQVALKTEGSTSKALELTKAMARLSGPEAMALYVKKMEEAKLSQDQMSFLMESMASDSTLLIPLLKNNAEGMKLWGEAAEDAGIILNDKTIKAARELQVQTKMLDMQMQGMKNQLMASVMPALVDIADAFSTGDKEARGMADGGKVLADSLRGVAAIALGVWATLNLISNSIAGVTSQALDSYELTSKAAQNGGFLDKFPGIQWAKTFITTGVTASAENSYVSMAGRDNDAVIKEFSEKTAKIFDDTVSSSTKKLAELQELANKGTAAATQGVQDWKDQQDKVAESAKKLAQAQQELNRKLEERKRLQDSIIYEYGDKEYQMQLNYERQANDIKKAFEGEQQQRFLTIAKNRYDTEKALYLSKLAFEISEHRLTEEEKLNFQYQIDQKEIAARTDITDADKASFYRAAREKHDQSMAWMRLESAQRLNDAQAAFQTEMQNLTAKFEFEREQIRLNKSLDPAEQSTLIASSYRTQDLENEASRHSAWMDYQSATGVDTSAEDAANRRAEAIKNAFEWQLITQEEYQQKMLASEAQFNTDKAALGAQAAADTLSGMTDLMGSLIGEQSGAYKAMFAMSKAFAVAQAFMNAPQTFSNVYTSVSAIPLIGPYIAPVMAGAAVAVQVAQASQIKSVSLDGMAHDGISSVPEDGTWFLKKGERVLDDQQNSALTRFLNSNGGQMNGFNININNYAGARVNTRRDENGLTIDIVDERIAGAFTRLGSESNSHESQMVQQAFNVERRR